MKNSFVAVLCCINMFTVLCSCAQTSPKYLQNKTLTYEETIDFYRDFATEHASISRLIEYGNTDAQVPLHLLVINKDGNFDAASIRKGKRVVFINNAIHPGEPCGVDACVELIQQIADKKNPLHAMLDSVVVCVIPIYNIGGALNRNNHSRANQNGPDEYGFRGSARNYDLNRDFMKCDSENARTFAMIFAQWQPDVFIDTHISNGADYQYTMTLIASHANNYPTVMSDYLYQKFIPSLYQSMNKTPYMICPYVETVRETPDDGLMGFVDSPRFSSGFTSQFHALSFTTETHMLKPYQQQVEATIELLKYMLLYTYNHATEIASLRQLAIETTKQQQDFVLRWQPDTSRYDNIEFKGYAAVFEPSKIGSYQRLRYDRNKPYTKTIRYYRYSQPVVNIQKPKAYIVPQAWSKVIDLLKVNGVVMHQLTADSSLEAEITYIDEVTDSPRSPYEGHYLHTKVNTRTKTENMTIKKGDYIIRTGQANDRYLVNALEIKGEDSFFAWNYFDAVLQQKEWFSPYVFEDIAADILKNNPTLAAELQQKIKDDAKFAADEWAVLLYVYQHSEYYEKVHRRYPILRVLK